MYFAYASFSTLDKRTWLADPLSSCVGGNWLLTLSDAAIEKIASGKSAKKRFSKGFLKLLARTSNEITALISVLISTRPKCQPPGACSTAKALAAWAVAATKPQASIANRRCSLCGPATCSEMLAR